MGENTFTLQKNTLASLLLALMQWRGWHVFKREVRISITPISDPKDLSEVGYRAVVTYIDQ